MMKPIEYVDVVVLGSGPAGLAAAFASAKQGANTVVLERQERPGGILKQCIHDGFGNLRYNETLTGPEYAYREIQQVIAALVPIRTNCFVASVEHGEHHFLLNCISPSGIERISARALVLATGCRERTDRQVFIHGDRPAGIFTAGLAQRLINIDGLIPGNRAVILGSGDIGLIMARRLSIEGVQVEGVHEIRHESSGLKRNIQQCLEDFDIPLYVQSTVTSVVGSQRVKAVHVAAVDVKNMPIMSTEQYIPCDTLILSVGLIPENELAHSLDVPIDPVTKGPVVDHVMHTMVDGVFACGNCVHVSELVDYVSESGSIAGKHAAAWALDGCADRTLVPVSRAGNLAYVVPQMIDTSSPQRSASCYFRVRHTIERTTQLRINSEGQQLDCLTFDELYPPQMERFAINETIFSSIKQPSADISIELVLVEASHD
ncbi:MAG: FAD-dependent oxidoreductase [Sphaerochaetaceae bacterium]|jgi:NADPH-dependent 2,4-dienoyl-CoA reductase/sulfur reductase-like enzyme|nr:FAD-dependent oxidoreductase [Sphaerochaetaceae bacterium]